MKDEITAPISPNTRWGLSEPRNVVHLKNWEFLLLFGQVAEVTVQKGVLNFQINKKLFYYTMYKTEMLHNINFQKVRVRFDPADLTHVHLFTMDDEYLETIKPSLRAHRNEAGVTADERENIYEHAENVKTITMETMEDLEYYNKVVSEVENDIPVEALDILVDSKETVDQSHLSYYMGITEEVSIKTAKDSKKKKSLTKKTEQNNDALEAAKKYSSNMVN